MKHVIWILMLCLLLPGCTHEPAVPPTTEAPTLQTQAVPEPETTAAPEIVPQTTPPTTEAPETTEPPLVVDISEEDRELLKKLAMAEVGRNNCIECAALVMRTVLNRLDSGNYGSSISSIIYAEGQFPPAHEEYFEYTLPSAACADALDLVLHGWDESEGALFFEYIEGESWHSQNLTLLKEHCDTRFYK